MISGENLVWNFERNASYLRTHLADLTHADSLVQPPVNGNCINWIVGHIVCYRNLALGICDLPLVVSPTVAERYERGSAPVIGAATDVAPFDTLVQAYWRSQEQLIAYLRTMTAEQAGVVVSAGDFTMPRSELLTSFMRHESYHAGQLELLRELVMAAR
ncbi:MAG: DinB family protein [Caldilinea sp. CFX5]|nr:DinB family protein [Caldilinea sp. CFX5]